MDDISDLLHEIYYNTSHPGSFGGSEILLKEAKKINPLVSRKDVVNWLNKQLVYTLHKQVRHRFKRNPVFAEFVNENFQIDLIDLKEFSRQNNGYKYLLSCIDVFSKRAWALPIKTKSQENVCKAVEDILTESTPYELMTDKGKEFDNSQFKKLMKKYNVNHYFAKNTEIKCSVVERFNKTLKNKMFKHFTTTGKRRYVEDLQNFIDAYNNRYHRSIKMTPMEAKNNQKQVFKNLYGVKDKREYLKKYIKPKLKLNEQVRIKYVKKIHDRGYHPKWTDQTFNVHKSFPGRFKSQYIIKDSDGNIVKKHYYPEEIQKVNTQTYRVEKVLRKRIRNGITEYLVKWLNYPSTENSWTPASEIINING